MQSPKAGAHPLERLVSVIQELSIERDLAGIMLVVRCAARALTGADGATFVLRDGDRCYYADEDAIEPLWKGQRFPIEACVSGWAMLHREPVVIEDIYDDPRVPVDAYRPTFVKSLVMVPIRTVSPVGAIGNYWARRHRATDEEVQVLSALADSTSVALENAELYRTLEQRVADRTAELLRVQRQKEEMAALLVHDLRSPADGIMLSCQARLRNQALSANDRRAWSNVHASADAISRMALDLLDVTRSEDGAFASSPRDTDVAALLAGVHEQMMVGADGREQRLELSLDFDRLAMRLDPELVRRVLQNLVDNALRHNASDGTVRVIGRATDDALELRVIDEGPGIPEGERARVFEKYAQLDGGARRSGRGLGLAFCRLAIDAHGGTIAIEANDPHGAVFVVRLPRR